MTPDGNLSGVTLTAAPVGDLIRVRPRPRARVLDACGVGVSRGAATVPLPVTGATASADLPLPHPRLWDVDDPYTYRMVIDVVVGGRVVDSYQTGFGVRTARFDPANGFFLNGRPLKLHGVDLHHDEGALGSAVNSDALLRQLRIMKGMGVNAVRTSPGWADGGRRWSAGGLI